MHMLKGEYSSYLMHMLKGEYSSYLMHMSLLISQESSLRSQSVCVQEMESDLGEKGWESG